MEGSGDNSEIYKVLFFGSRVIESQNEFFQACIIVTVIALVFQGNEVFRSFWQNLRFTMFNEKSWNWVQTSSLYESMFRDFTYDNVSIGLRLGAKKILEHVNIRRRFQFSL